MSEGEHKASVQHTPAEWTSSNQDQYVNADKARYNSEKVSTGRRHTDRGSSVLCRSGTRHSSSSAIPRAKHHGESRS